MKKFWFPAKKYGWGWGFPVTWQGWVVLLAYIAFFAWNSIGLDAESQSDPDTIRQFVIDSCMASAVLIAIAYKTGEKPRWRWGDKKKSNHERT